MLKGNGGYLAMLVVSFVMASSAAHAVEQYQTEVSAVYSRFDTDDDLRVISSGLAAEWYFSQVNTSDHPYAEAAFLERIGSVFATIQKMDTKFGAFEADGPMTLIGVNYTRPDFPLAIQAGVGYGKLDIDATSGDVKIKSYQLNAGYFLAKTLLAGIEYSTSKEEVSIAPTDLKQTDYALFGKYVHEIDNRRTLNIEARLAREKVFNGVEDLTNTIGEVLVDYYFSRSLSIGAGIANSSGQDDSRDGIIYSARARYFFVPLISIEAGYETFQEAHDGYAGDKSFDVVLAVRF